MKSFSHHTIVGLLIIFSIACSNDIEEGLPDIRFNSVLELINIDPLYTKNNPFIVTTDRYGNGIGLAGVVIYKVSAEEFYVFERMCQYEKSIEGVVEISEENNFICECPNCSSKYMVAGEFGDVMEGPASFGLKRYDAFVQGDDLVICN